MRSAKTRKGVLWFVHRTCRGNRARNPQVVYENFLVMVPAQSQQILESFVKFLCDRREMIAAEWVSLIHRNGQLQTPEKLASEELKEHFPALFDDLADALQNPADERAQGQAHEDARSHGRKRLEQNYRLEELVREIAAKRTALITQITAFEEQTRGFEGTVKRVVLQRLHGFLDNLVAVSTIA